jgi:hypothetical protein
MTAEPHKRILALLDEQTRLERERQAVIAGLPDLADLLLPAVRGGPAVVATAHGQVVYRLRPVRWANPLDAEEEFDRQFEWEHEGVASRPVAGEVHLALCRDAAVLSSPPRPGLALVEVRVLQCSGMTLADIEDEPGLRAPLRPAPVDDFAWRATDDDWRAFAAELHALLAILEQRVGDELRHLESVHARVRGVVNGA